MPKVGRVLILGNSSIYLATFCCSADDGKKLFVTLHIQNVTKEYDGQLTQVLCKGYAAGVHDQGMGFRITVIKSKCKNFGKK